MKREYFVPLMLIQWQAIGITFEGKCVGYLPVYETIEALRKDYKNASYIRIESDVVEMVKEEGGGYRQ
jgi:hypothetical protein